jgi:hypothetical protein
MNWPIFVSRNPSAQTTKLPCYPRTSLLLIFSTILAEHNHKAKMPTLPPHLSDIEGIQATLSVPGPKDPPNTPVPRLIPSAGAPDADRLEQLLVEVIDNIQVLDEPGEAVCSVVSRSGNASSESMALGINAWIAIRYG